MKLSLLSFLIATFTATFISAVSFAQSLNLAQNSVPNEKEEAEIVQKARSRSYAGGSDESDLKVQSLLLKPTRKIEPSADESVDSSAAQD